MWKLGNRVVIVLVCVLSGSVILYNIWGSILAVIITLLLVIYASFLLLTNDNHQTPHALLLLEYFERAGEKLYNLLQNINQQTTIHAINLIEIAKKFYENYIITKMDRRHRNTYQLSTDTFNNSNRNTEFSMVEGLTPIVKNLRRSYISGSENNSGIDSENARGYNGDGGGGGSSSSNSSGRSFDKVTSTPLIQWEMRQSHNGDINNRNLHISAINHPTTLKRPPSVQFNDSNMLRGEETVYTPRGSPWGTSISPKMRPKAAGVKTVQTVAGPLLTSTRYNIDPKVHTDITSPGLTSRLAKYATEANMKLTHQSQYVPGQFPKVNLNASPTPIISARSTGLRSRMKRSAVTVTVAPPEITKYSPSERQKILSSICQTNNKTPASVVQVLKEISLKRHASHDDMTTELAKKQRTDGIHDDESENYEEITQKRGRDDSSKSEGEVSIDNTPIRPIKRTKIPSCYDILNSLSSSTNLSSGVKRKADISRSGTPDIGKHFKSLDNIQRSRSVSISPQQNVIFRSQSDSTDNRLDDSLSSKKLLNSVSPKVISPFTNTLKKTTPKNEKKMNSNNVSVKLTDRLFMRAEPQNIDKLKSLIEEHSNISSKFNGDDGEEIKKSDVVNMRQTSMKVRLQSMFDAISGKISGRIDPNVVIQAEHVNSSTSVSTISSSSSSSTLLNQQSSSTLTTLNSSTSTTSINTSPISTSAVIPIIGKTKTSTTPGKHVTFSLPTSTQMSNNESILSTATKSSISLPSTNLQQKLDDCQKSETKSTTSLPSVFGVSTPTNSISLPTFGLNPSNVASTATNSTLISTPTSSINLSSTQSTSSLLLTPSSSKSSAPIAFGASQLNTQQIQSSTPSNFTMTTEKPVSAPTTTATFTFGTSPIVSTTTVNPQTSAALTPSTSIPGFQSTITTPPTSVLTIPSANLFSTNKSLISTSFTGTSNTVSSSITTPTFSFGQPSSNASLLQSATNTSNTGGFTFGAKNISNVNLTTTSATAITTTAAATTATTTSNQLGISTNSQAVAIATSPTFTLGVNTSNTSTSTFGTDIPNASKNLTCDSNNSMVISTTSTPATTSSSLFSFGATPATTKPLFSFGASNNSQTMATNNPLSFGTTSQPLVFGSNANNNSTSITTTTQNESSFGTVTTNSQSNVTTSSNTMSFTFGTANTQPPTFPSTTSSTANGNAINSFDVTQKTTATPNFSMNSTMPTTTSTSLFNNTNSNNIFGQSKITSTSAFGTPSSVSSNFMNNTNNTFGNTGQSLSFQQPLTTVSFGTPSSAISMSGSTFGTPNTTSSDATTSSVATSVPTAFGTANPSSTSSGFGTLKSIVPSFGTGSNNFGNFRPGDLVFGSQNQNTASPFGGNTSVFGTGVPTTTAPPPTFGDTTSTPIFGTPGGFNNTNSSVPAFNNPVGNTGFNSGYGSANSTNQISPFGNQPSNTPAFGNANTSISSFGTPSSNNPSSTSSGGFSFGGTPTNQSQQQNAPFTFGGVNTNTTNNTATSAGAPFQFNATPTPQIGGFNFTGGTAPPTFGGSSAGGSSTGSSGGMFSIGSGSTAPRSRSTRPRRQQR